MIIELSEVSLAMLSQLATSCILIFMCYITMDLIAVMYASIECTSATNNNTNQPTAQGQQMHTATGDGVNQDVITHEEQHRVKHPKGDAKVKKREVKKNEVKKKEVKRKRVKKKEDIVGERIPEMIASAVPDKQKEQSEPIFDSEVYNKLIHVTSKSQPQHHVSLEYSQIALENIRDRSSKLVDGSKLNQQQKRGRTSSPLDEPPPLPPPFVDDECAEVTGTAKASLQTDIGGARRQKTFGISGVELKTQHVKAGPSIYNNIFSDEGTHDLDAALYDDPICLQPRQDVYMNVVKR